MKKMRGLYISLVLVLGAGVGGFFVWKSKKSKVDLSFLDREYLALSQGISAGGFLNSAFKFEDDLSPTQLAKCFRGNGKDCKVFANENFTSLENEAGQLNLAANFGSNEKCNSLESCDFQRRVSFQLFCVESSCDRLVVNYGVQSAKFPSNIRESKIEVNPKVLVQAYFRGKYSRVGLNNKLTAKTPNPPTQKK